jgi:hypothetical protein
MIRISNRTFLSYHFKKQTLTIFSIHPRTKHDVGYRLSRSVLAIAYGQQIEFQGPIVENVTYSNDSQTIEINYTSVSSIELRNQNGLKVCRFYCFSLY